MPTRKKPARRRPTRATPKKRNAAPKKAAKRRATTKRNAAPKKRSTARHHYEVIVSNIGTVYDGHSGETARDTYREYVAMSKAGRGRAGGESVTLMKDDDILTEYQGENLDY